MNDENINYWKAIIKALEEPSLSQKRWLEENNISPSTYYKWVRYFKNSIEDKPRPKTFVPVDLKESNDQVLKDKISIEINGDIIRIDESMLSKVIGALK